jgi:hypothetical protein
MRADELELAGHVGASQAEIARGGDEVAQGAFGVQPQRQPGVGFADDGAVGRLDPHGYFAVGDSADQVRDRHRVPTTFSYIPVNRPCGS